MAVLARQGGQSQSRPSAMQMLFNIKSYKNNQKHERHIASACACAVLAKRTIVLVAIVVPVSGLPAAAVQQLGL